MVEPVSILLLCAGTTYLFTKLFGGSSDHQKAEIKKLQKADPVAFQHIVKAGNKQQQLMKIIAKIPHSLTQDDAFIKKKDWEHGVHASTGRPDCFFHAPKQHCDYHQLLEAVLHARLHGKGHIGSSAAKELADALDGMLRDAKRLGF
jgi:hypothetical protein